MKISKEDKQFEQLVQKIDPQSRLLRRWKLGDGISTEMMAFEVALPNGQTRKMIKRGSEHELHRYKQDSHIEKEFKLLQRLHADGFAVPRPYHFEHASEIFSGPCLVLEYIEGEMIMVPSDEDDYLLQFAQQLAKIHQYDGSRVDLSFLPLQADMISNLMDQFGHSVNKVCTKDILDAIWPIPQHNKSVLVHGDFWFGNVLWKDGKLVAVLDWEFATLGDPLFDLALARLETVCQFGRDAMHKFTANYTSIMNHLDFSTLHYWELWIAFYRETLFNQFPEWFGDDNAFERIRSRHKWFTNQALEKLSA